MQQLARLPLFVILLGIVALAMLVPGLYAHAIDQHWLGAAFLSWGGLLMILAAMLGIATASRPRRALPREVLLTMIGAMVGLPAAMALPFRAGLPDTGFANAWWEMISCVTTTGATLYAADRVAEPLHLWRAMAGWMGGLFMLVAAVALLAPLRVGGFEITALTPGHEDPVLASRPAPRRGRSTHLSPPGWRSGLSDPSARAIRAFGAVFPPYAGLTLAMWLALLVLGEPGLVALTRAMGTLSTSAISPVDGPAVGPGGLAGEVVILLFLVPALSRRFWPGGTSCV